MADKICPISRKKIIKGICGGDEINEYELLRLNSWIVEHLDLDSEVVIKE